MCIVKILKYIANLLSGKFIGIPLCNNRVLFFSTLINSGYFHAFKSLQILFYILMAGTVRNSFCPPWLRHRNTGGMDGRKRF